MPGHARARCAANVMPRKPDQAQVLHFADLNAWLQDSHQDALQCFIATCDLIDGDDWKPLCRLAPDALHNADASRQFFEQHFRPVLVGRPPALFTGYYEPELAGSRVRTARFAYPIYRMPPDLAPGTIWFSRAEIEAGALLHGHGLELAWLDDPVDVYFLMVQGSGRIGLPDGSVLRVGYAGKNGHPYRSIGQSLVRRGLLPPEEVSAQAIRDWIAINPVAGAALFNENPSFVFFRGVNDLPTDKGPIGAMARSLTPLRSVAVDASVVPLGAPVWIDKAGRDPLRRPMVAQDTGSAITGAQRADIFYGTGAAAGGAAGRIKDGGRMVILLPVARAVALLPGG